MKPDIRKHTKAALEEMMRKLSCMNITQEEGEALIELAKKRVRVAEAPHWARVIWKEPIR